MKLLGRLSGPTVMGRSLAFCILALLGAAPKCLSMSTSTSQMSTLLSEAHGKLQQWIVSARRELHAIPELGFQESKTSAVIKRLLDETGIDYRSFAGTGISASIGSGWPIVALRADIDALPIEESFDEAQVPFKSIHPGRMHACGHDAHTAMLLGAANLLKRREKDLQGTVVLVFQPGEEGLGGAVKAISEGALRGAQAIAGIHVWPTLPSGIVATRPGTIMAAADMFTVHIIGRGGHGAMPHLTADPVVAAAAVVGALQPLVSRETSPTAGAVVTVARFNTGPGAGNVIPDAVELQGTLRALNLPVFDHLRKRFVEVVTSVAAAHGCNASAVTWNPVPYPPTINDPTMVSLVANVTSSLEAANLAAGIKGSGIKYHLLAEPSMAAEDFSFYGHQVPAVFSFLGIGNSSIGTDSGLHTATFQMDESQLPLGAALHAAFALEFLATHQRSPITASTHDSKGTEL